MVITFFFFISPVLFITALFLTDVIRKISLKKNILDIPNQRSLHQLPTPRGGGFAFVFLFYLTATSLFLTNFISLTVFLSLLGGIPIACVGYCDDVFGVKSYWRACIHLLSAVWGIAWLGGVPFLNFGQMVFHAPLLLFFISVFITVWFINLYNFMDGVDGLAGIEAVFVSFASGCVLLLHGVHVMAVICFSLGFSVLGFLVLNWPPAKIFMGDVGSGFLGYIFAMLMWITNNQHQLPFPLWWILLAVFITDTTYTLIYRIIQKKNWGQAHREHAFQRLIQLGLTHKTITVGILCVNVLVCLPLAKIYLHPLGNDFFAPYLFLIASAFWLIWFLIVKKSRL